VHLYDVPLIFALVGLVFYTVLGGADFGAGLWQLTARGPRTTAIRDHAHNAMGPVWEANHVWLVFVLTVVWTAYPAAFGAIASTLSIPLFIAAVGIIFRGTTYALRSGTSSRRELRLIDTTFSLASILTPFALGTVVGGIASRRVPVGNAAGDQVTSWLNPTSLLIGILAVAAAGYTAAVFLCADAVRAGERQLEAEFRKRGLLAGIIAGGIALGGFAVLRGDAEPLYHRLVEGRGVVALAVSIAAGLATLALVWHRRYEPARYSAALAVAAVVAGWALAQAPLFLRDLTIQQAAASRDTLLAVIAAVLGGGVILFPSLALLFRLVLGGTLDHGEALTPAALGGRIVPSASRAGLLARVAVACLIVGVGLTTIANASWAHAVGVTCLLGFVAIGFPAALPPDVVGIRDPPRLRSRAAAEEPGRSGEARGRHHPGGAE
jgi:cytochrome bd ubiquinol oxidase subunit II